MKRANQEQHLHVVFLDFFPAHAIDVVLVMQPTVKTRPHGDRRIGISGERPAEESEVAIFTSERAYEYRSQDNLFDRTPSPRCMDSFRRTLDIPTLQFSLSQMAVGRSHDSRPLPIGYLSYIAQRPRCALTAKVDSLAFLRKDIYTKSCSIDRVPKRGACRVS